MYEHPIKRAGLSINRIIFSNTRMVMAGFPNLQAQQFNLSFKYRTYDQGKVVATKCKRVLSVLTPFRLDFTSDDLDDVLPSRKKE